MIIKYFLANWTANMVVIKCLQSSHNNKLQITLQFYDFAMDIINCYTNIVMQISRYETFPTFYQ